MRAYFLPSTLLLRRLREKRHCLGLSDSQAAVGVGVAAGEVEDERLSAGQVVLIVEVEGGCGGVVAAVVEQFQGEVESSGL